MKAFVSGLANVETTVSVRGFPIPYYPIDYPFFGINSNVGGVGFNLAKSFITLGDEATLATFLAGDMEGDHIRQAIIQEHIMLKEKQIQQTPVSIILFDPEGKRQIYCDLKDIQEQRLMENDVAKEIADCDIAVLCNINFTRNLLHVTEHPIACDVHVLGDIDDAYNKDFMAASSILFLSDEHLPCEASRFIFDLWQRYRNRVIVIGMGSKGAMLLDDDAQKIYRLDPPVCDNIVNTVGAGDALFSSFLHYYVSGMDGLNALMHAETYAGIKIGHNGASLGFAREAEVSQRLSNYPINYAIVG